jgi:hypothetical protein
VTERRSPPSSFIALLLGYLLWRSQLTVLKWAALLGTVMPVTDAVLAYQAERPPA